jgi:type II secretory pathway pseudopilin PulG
MDHSLNKNGYLLIESVVAITMVTVGLLGIFSLLSRSLSLNRVVSDRYVAAYLAAEGLEIIKNLIDNNVLAGLAWNVNLEEGSYQFDYKIKSLPPSCGFSCRQVFYFNEDSQLYSYNPTSRKTSFQRTVSIAPNRDKDGFVQSLKVNSTVNWSGRGGSSFNVNLEDRFYNYR